MVGLTVRETIAKPFSNSRGWRNDTDIGINVGHEAFARITLMVDKQVASIGITRRRRHAPGVPVDTAVLWGFDMAPGSLPNID